MVVDDVPVGDRTQSILRHALHKAGSTFESFQGVPDNFWDGQFFNLERTSVYRSARRDVQQQIVSRCNRGLLEEAFYIEDAGMVYASRMCMLADSDEERMLYALFAADEATHYAWVKEALGQAIAQVKPNAFHRILNESIAAHNPATLVFLIQVVLEGWGLQRYSDMMRGCQEPWFRQVLQAILKDEARHHGGGVVLNVQKSLVAKLGRSERQVLIDTLRQFLGMVQVGPQAVLSAIDEAVGGLSRAERVKTLEELDTMAHSASRLNTLRQLMAQEGAHDVIVALEELRAFDPLEATRCV
jgi:rubrerythrin